MKKTFEIAGIIAFVLVGTGVAYLLLAGLPKFWDAQTIWSIILMVGWVVVSLGYFHQGWLVYRDSSSAHVSVLLPSVVFLVQCVLFVKGVYYNDWSLIGGALLVNIGVLFSLTQIYLNRKGVK